MLSFLFGLINPLNSIVNAIANERAAYYNASTDVQKAQIQAKISQLETQRDVLVADASHSKIDMLIRAGLTLPLVAYFSKVIMWDKVIGSWPDYSTDKLGDQNMVLVYAVLGFYFLYSTAKLFR